MCKKSKSQHLPDQKNWEKLLNDAGVATEVVDIDEHGHYDPKKSPDFDEWMKEG